MTKDRIVEEWVHNFSSTLTADSVCKVNARRNMFHKINDTFDIVLYCQGLHDHFVVEPRHKFNNIIMPVRYMLSSVWVSFSIFSQLSIIQYMGLCVFSLPISLVMIERICTISYYHHQIGGVNYHPLFRVRWITKLILHFTGHAITYPCLD